MLTELILAVLILSDFALLIFAIALCFMKSSIMEFDYIYRAITGILFIVLNYYLSQLFINGFVVVSGTAITSQALNTFFFWFMGGFGLLYVALQIIFYVLDKLDYISRRIVTNVGDIVQKDYSEVAGEMSDNVNGRKH